jgi:hypothetical protein
VCAKTVKLKGGLQGDDLGICPLFVPTFEDAFGSRSVDGLSARFTGSGSHLPSVRAGHIIPNGQISGNATLAVNQHVSSLTGPNPRPALPVVSLIVMPSSDNPTEKNDEIRCRVAACPEALGDDKEWSFYLLNDGSVPLDLVVLKTFGREWGNIGETKHPNVKLTSVGTGASVLIWRDNDEELRMWLELLVRVRNREAALVVEFPMLYKRRGNLPLVAGLDKPGWVVSAVET